MSAWGTVNLSLTRTQSILASRMHKWAADAACKGNPDFGTETESMHPSQRRRHEMDLITICSACPAQPQCLEHAMLFPEMAGVWGGKNAEQRRALRRYHPWRNR